MLNLFGFCQALRTPVPPVLVAGPVPAALKAYPVGFTYAGTFAALAHVDKPLFEFHASEMQAVAHRLQGKTADAREAIDYIVAGLDPTFLQCVLIDAYG